MDTDNRLGTFLRARRQQVGPEEFGMAGGGQRRVAGLRREEVAMLAGERCSLHTPHTRAREGDNNVTSPVRGSVFDHIATTESVGAS